MESFKVENLTFRYPCAEENALDGVSFSVEEGEFVTICGRSGSGKSTLLRQLKSVLSPSGERSGSVYFRGKRAEEFSLREQSEYIGFVLQNPENQIVTDKVWHELAFGLESLGMKTEEIRARVSETASFFGIQNWFHKSVSELSGGQKQLLALASVMVMQPKALILDEPTSTLDPIAAHDFLEAVYRINRETGTSVILSEQRLEEALPLSDRVLVMEGGRIVLNCAPKVAGSLLKEKDSDMLCAMPTAVRVYALSGGTGESPVTVREGRAWLREQAADFDRIGKHTIRERMETAIEARNVWFRYEKNLPDVLKGFSMKVCKGEIFAILGGNGAGKTTALSVIAGIKKPYRGKMTVKSEKVCLLPQDPKTLFVKKTVVLDLLEMLSEEKLSEEEKRERIKNVSRMCEIGHLLKRHPYDLSGGELQRAALAKLLLKKPGIILLDEPTKGLDACFKKKLADILGSLTKAGATVVLVSHDVEFCAEYADRCAMFFDGSIASEGEAREFFAGKSFYTTAANRMARGLSERVVLAGDILYALGIENQNENKDSEPHDGEFEFPEIKEKPKRKAKFFWGAFFSALFILAAFLARKMDDNPWMMVLSLVLLALGLNFFVPQREMGSLSAAGKRKIGKSALLPAAFLLVCVPLTLYAGIRFLGDRKYYFISLMIILETFAAFAAAFEGRGPKAREVVVISVMCALGVAGRSAFSMLPQFKPVAAVVIISGVCLGAEAGFLTGAVTAFVSNFFFMQGAWTPWQMFAFGLVGFFAGVFFHGGLLRKTRLSLCVFGAAVTIFVYGGIMDPASVVMVQGKLNPAMVLSACALGLPYNIVHAVSTVFFLWFASEPMIEKIDRVKLKFGMNF